MSTSSADPHRPIYHFLPPQGWLNDPNGLIQWGDDYHLFYQHNPYGAFHDRIHWGHAVSPDMVRWQHLPIALAPDADGPDADGCWSGCAVDDGGVPTFIYSGNRAGQQRACLATSHDGLLSWHKAPENPLIPELPSGLDLVAYRDHCVWREGDAWHMLIGAGLRGVGGAALLYRSPDLRRWEYMHPLCVGDLHQTTPLWTGAMWECPDLFPLGDRHVLNVSVWDNNVPYYSAALTGRYVNHRFQPAQTHKLDYGDRYFYAPQSFRDRRGRRLIFGWLPEGRGEAAQRASGWSGVMSLPRELHLLADGTVVGLPIAALAQLRRTAIHSPARSLAPGQILPLAPIAGDALEIQAEIKLDRQGGAGLIVRRSPDGGEETRISYDGALGQLRLERERSSQDSEPDRSPHSAPLALADGEPLRLQIFLDRSVIEIFANERVSISSRIYPGRPDSLGVAAFAQGAPAALASCAAWELGPPR